jgi:hypothetical protein
MREKLERRKHFNNAINADDDDTMIRVFDNAQEQVNNRKYLTLKFLLFIVFFSFILQVKN